MRSWLFVPGNDAAKIGKAQAAGADAVILDLEDSVAPGDKATARKVAAKALSERAKGKKTPQIWVRINALDTGLTEADLDAVTSAAPDGIMLPKAEGVASLVALDSLLTSRERNADLKKPLPVIAIATETARGLFKTAEYEPGAPRLEALTWGAEDLSADIGAVTNKDDEGNYTEIFTLARTLSLAAATSARVQPVDTVYVNFRNSEGLRAECLAAARDGFTGKLAIHPAQVAVINEVFTPSEQDIARAKAIIAAFAQAGDAGVVGLDGEMLDAPHRIRAEKLLARARHYGLIAD
jgi:citrate lyase subunit beta/citryl-CoA lyase